MKLTYEFDNDEKKLDIEKYECLSPSFISVYTREGDTIYVADGDYVFINQLIKESTSGIKTYSSISGNVKMEPGVIKVINDNTDSSLVSEEALDKIDDVRKDVIIKSCENLGIEYENKLIASKLKSSCKLLVVNAMDIEPYQFNNNYLVQDKVDDLLSTIDLLSNKFNVVSYFLLNKFDDNNIDAVKKVIKKYPNIIFKVINDVFPFTTNQCVARKYFKEYKYEDILFLDSFALNKIYVALKEGLPVSERYITLILDDATRVAVINAKYGTNLKHILEDVAKFDLINKDIYLNNFMRKVKCNNIESLVVSDNVKTIFVMEHDETRSSKCIKCGKCVDICPVDINPLAKKLDAACIRCGLCNYVCPANINLINKEN